MATVAVALISSMTANHALQTGGTAGKNIVLVDLVGPELPNAGPTGVTVPSLVTRLRAVDGVTAVLVSHLDRAGTADDSLVDCAQLARLSALGRCAAGASVGVLDLVPALREQHVWPTAGMPLSQLDGLPASGLLVGTDGSTTAIEMVRTMVETTFPFRAAPDTAFETQQEQVLAAWQQLAEAVILASLPIAGSSPLPSRC